MSATYSGDPSASPLDEVRFLIQDTNVASAQLQDAEINYAIKLVYGTSPPASGNYLPAAYCADSLRAKYAGQVDSKSVGDLRVTYAARAERYAALAAQLRSRATIAAVPVYVGGESLADKQIDQQDPDVVQPAIVKDGMNIRGYDTGSFDPWWP